MAEATAVRISQETVNDNVVLLRAWHVAEGATVKPNDLLAEIETSKATLDIVSPVAGVVHRVATEMSEIGVGEILCYVGVDTPTIATINSSNGEQHPLPASKDRSHRFSKKALKLLDERGLDEAEIPLEGLVRERDLDRWLSKSTNLVDKDLGKGTRRIRLSVGKRAEIQNLSWDHGAVLRSQVICHVKTLGQAALTACQPDGLARRSAFIIRTCAELLSEFPNFNCYCAGDELYMYDNVAIGYAVDLGKGLKVPVFRNPGETSIDELVAKRQELIDRYLADTLRPTDVTGATFTITDLSSTGIASFDPLLPANHSAILGIAGEESDKGGHGRFQLILSFDHRVTNGREAARFLGNIKERIEVYEQGLITGPNGGPATLRPCSAAFCSRCGLTWQEANRRGHFLLNAVTGPLGETGLICTICVGGN